jgi:hypothetical protein
MARSSILYQAMAAAQTKIQGLSLTGLDSTDIVLQKVLVQRDGTALPCIILAPGPSIPQSRGTNLRDDWVRNIQVGIFAADNQDASSASLDNYLLWQEQIEHAFISQPLTITSTTYGHVLECSIAAHNNLDFAHWRNNLLVSAFFIQVKTREPRT